MIEAPVPFGNAASRWFYVLLKELMAKGHDVTAFAACSKESEVQEARRIFPRPSFDLRCFMLPHRRGMLSRVESYFKPYSYMFSNELKSDLKNELRKGFDILHLEQLWCAWLGLRHREKALVNVHHLTWIDLEHLQADRSTFNRDVHRMLQTERRLIREMKYFRSCSPRLEPEILRENGAAFVKTVPVGIDSSLYTYIPDERRSKKPVVSVIGTMGWYPSRSAAERLLTKLWPEIHRQVPEATAQVIGWSARSALKDYLNLPNVSIQENVPDTKPYFENTSVLCYAPGRGSGMKIKILEALGYGVPVVTTSEGVEGLPAADGVHAGVCEDDEGLIQRTVSLLKNVDLQNRQRREGRALLELHCSPKSTVGSIEGIYEEMLKGNK